MCALRGDSGLRAIKPRPVGTCSRFHIVQTLFRTRTNGAICQWRWPGFNFRGGGKHNVRGRGEGVGGGYSPPTVRAFCILMLLMVQFGEYARYFPRIAQIYI